LQLEHVAMLAHHLEDQLQESPDEHECYALALNAQLIRVKGEQIAEQLAALCEKGSAR
jgi:hypothetical protein